MSATDDVVEAMALALFDDHAERMGFGYRSEHLDARGRKIAIETWKPRILIAIRAAHERGGLMVARMPGEKEAAADDYTASERQQGWNDGFDYCRQLVRAAAVEVEG